MTLTEKVINEIIELREKGLTISQTANALKIGESTVKKYTSDDYERDNKIDEKTGKALSDIMLEEYDFEEGILPLVYKLKIQANEIDIYLFDYLTDISNIMNKFLRITNNPERLYYIICELSNNLSVITDNIEANDYINAVNNWYDREISMEESEKFLAENEEKAERLLENVKKELNIWQKNINNAQNEHANITSINSVIANKIMNKPNEEKLKISEEKIKRMENQIKKSQMTNQILMEKCRSLEQSDKDYDITIQENIALNQIFKVLTKLFPQEINTITKELFPQEIQEITQEGENEQK